jgi:hypothetical protein
MENWPTQFIVAYAMDVLAIVHILYAAIWTQVIRKYFKSFNGAYIKIAQISFIMFAVFITAYGRQYGSYAAVSVGCMSYALCGLIMSIELLVYRKS